MRLINLAGRLTIDLGGERGIDIESASTGRFGPDPAHVFEHWDQFLNWASGDLSAAETVAIDESQVGPPSPLPRQVFAIGLNYREHALEAGLDLPEVPMVFTKFPSSVTGPQGAIDLPEGSIDYEVELVAVIGRTAARVRASEAWDYLAGLTVGQDLSDRQMQIAGPPPQQFNMAKSFPGFAPIGPALLTRDEFNDPDDIEIQCELNGVVVQQARTGGTIFTLAQIVEYLSSVVTLYPGDLVFTGTPSGIGWAREPKLLLGPDDTLITSAEQIGQMRHTFRAAVKA